MIIIKNIPLPPSSNALYSSFRGRLTKTKEGRDYQYKMAAFEIINKDYFDQIKLQLDKNKSYQIDTYFIFQERRLVGKKGQLKRLDASNRLKSCHDTISKAIGIDDKQFVAGYFEKIACDSLLDEQVIIVIKEIKLKTFKDIKKDITQW